MKVVVFLLAPLWSPHFETELELIARHRAQGDEVVVVTCQRSLSSCIANPYNRRIDCLACRSKYESGMAAIEVPADSQVSITTLVRQRDVGTPSLPHDADMQALRAVEVNGYNIGEGIASSLVSVLRDSDPDLAVHSALVKRLMKSAVEMLRTAEAAITQHDPDLVYVFNGRFATPAAVLEVCKKMSVPFRSHDALYETGQYWVVENGTVHSLGATKDRIEDVWVSGSDPPRTQLAQEFFEHRRFGGQGAGPEHLQFSRRQERNRLPAGVEPGYVAILNSSEDEFAWIEGYENPVYDDQIAALDAILDEPRLRELNFVLRVHPNLVTVENRQTRHLRGLSGRSNLKVVHANEDIDTYALMGSSRAVVTFGSTTGIEAVYWRRPSLLVGRAPFEDLGPLRITSHEHLVTSILDPPLAVDIEGALKFGYFMRAGGEFFNYFEQAGFHSGMINGVAIRPSPVPLYLRKARNALRDGMDAMTPGTDQRHVSQR